MDANKDRETISEEKKFVEKYQEETGPEIPLAHKRQRLLDTIGSFNEVVDAAQMEIGKIVTIIDKPQIKSSNKRKRVNTDDSVNYLVGSIFVGNGFLSSFFLMRFPNSLNILQGIVEKPLPPKNVSIRLPIQANSQQANLKQNILLPQQVPSQSLVTPSSAISASSPSMTPANNSRVAERGQRTRGRPRKNPPSLIRHSFF